MGLQTCGVCAGVEAGTHSGSNTRGWRRPAPVRRWARGRRRGGARRRAHRLRRCARVSFSPLRQKPELRSALVPRPHLQAAANSQPWVQDGAAALRAQRRRSLQRDDLPAAHVDIRHRTHARNSRQRLARTMVSGSNIHSSGCHGSSQGAGGASLSSVAVPARSKDHDAGCSSHDMPAVGHGVALIGVPARQLEGGSGVGRNVTSCMPYAEATTLLCVTRRTPPQLPPQGAMHGRSKPACVNEFCVMYI